MGKPSYDRVRFKFKDSENQRDACLGAATRAFGISMNRAQSLWRQEGVIVCRPSQFARFMIYRSEVAACNRFAQFDAELFTPCQDKIEDVSSNPADHC